MIFFYTCLCGIYFFQIYLVVLFADEFASETLCFFFFLFTYSMTMDKVLVNVSGFSFVKPIVKNSTCYKVVSACHNNTDSFNTHYKI